MAPFDLFFEHANDPLVVIDDRGRVVSANARFADLLEEERAALVGSPLADWIASDREAFASALADTDRRGLGYELTLRRRSGGHVPVHASTSLAVWEGRRLTLLACRAGVALTTLDGATEQRLRTLSLVVEQSPESVAVTDLEGRITYVNDAFVRHSGYAREEVLGQNPRLLQSGRTPRATYDALWKALRRSETWEGEFYNRRKDGSEYLERALVAPIRDADGAVTSYLAIKTDITRERALEQQLATHRLHLEQLVADRTVELERARIAAEAANVAKTAFLANMSHEIRTPMNTIVALSQMLRDECNDPTKAALAGRVSGAAQQLLGIVVDVLQFAKLEAGLLGVERAPFSPHDLVAMIAAAAAKSAAAKGIELRVELDTLPPTLVGDATRVSEILRNYVSNAVKFTHAGSVRIVGRVASADAGRAVVRFEVHDTGIGVSNEQARQLFAPFEQADPSTTRRYGGTGLGLAIVRRIADLLGGEVGVESTPAVGSTFWLQCAFGLEPAGRAPGSRPSPPTTLRPSASAPDSSPPASRVVAAAEAVRLAADLRGLRALLADDDAAAIDGYAPLREALRSRFGPLAEALDRQLETFAFADALESVDQMLAAG